MSTRAGRLVVAWRRLPPAMVLLPLFAVGLLAARLFLPPEGRGALGFAGAAAVAVELGLAALVLSRLPRFVRRLRSPRAAGVSRIDSLEEALAEVLPSRRLAAVLATELAMLAYGIGGWFRRSAVDAGDSFTVHRRRAWSLIAATLGFLVVVETVGLHVLLVGISPLAAWVASAASIYGLIWLAGDAHALRLRSHLVTPLALELQFGVRWRASIPRAAIRSVTVIDAKLARSHDLLACDLGWPNVLVVLSRPVAVRGLFGRKRTVSQLTLTVDRQNDFVSLIRPLLDPGVAL